MGKVNEKAPAAHRDPTAGIHDAPEQRAPSGPRARLMAGGFDEGERQLRPPENERPRDASPKPQSGEEQAASKPKPLTQGARIQLREKFAQQVALIEQQALPEGLRRVAEKTRRVSRARKHVRSEAERLGPSLGSRKMPEVEREALRASYHQASLHGACDDPTQEELEPRTRAAALEAGQAAAIADEKAALEAGGSAKIDALVARMIAQPEVAQAGKAWLADFMTRQGVKALGEAIEDPELDSERAGTIRAQVKALTDGARLEAAIAHLSETCGEDLVKALREHGGVAPGDLMSAADEGVAEAEAASKDAPAGPSVRPALQDAAAEAGRRSRVKSLGGPFNWGRFVEWLEERGRADGQVALVGYFKNLGQLNGGMALVEFADIGIDAGLREVCNAVSGGSLGRPGPTRIDWDRFSAEMRKVAPRGKDSAGELAGAPQIADPTDSGKLSKAGKGTSAAKGAASATGAGAGLVKGSVNPQTGDAAGIGFGGDAAVASSVRAYAGVVGGGIGIAGSAIDVAQGASAATDASLSGGKRAEGGLKASGATLEAGSSAAQTAIASAQLGATVSTLAAVVASASLAVVAGAALLVQGGIGAFTGQQRVSRLKEEEGELTDKRNALEAAIKAPSEDHDPAELAKAQETLQRLRELILMARAARERAALQTGVSVATAVKGAAVIVGGALLLASNPVGWMVLAGAGAVAAIAALVGWFRSRTLRKKLFDDAYDLPNASLGETIDEQRQTKLGRLGFASLSGWHEAYLATSAEFLFLTSKSGAPEAGSATAIITNLGLDPTVADTTAIARALAGN